MPIQEKLLTEELEYLDTEKLYKGIQEAKKNIDGVVRSTMLWYSSTFSDLTGANIYLKLENMQKTGSFKVRGALNAISKLSASQRAAGVVAASSGNHAQAVAFAANRKGIEATIVMPQNTPIAKVEATRGYKAKVILHGELFDEALAFAIELSKAKGMYFLHPFNDEAVIEGQGTIGLEVVEHFQRHNKQLDAVVIPVGGGGLSTGISVYVKKHFPAAKIIGVQAASSNSMELSLKEGRIVGAKSICTICDGIAVKRPGTKTLPLAQKYYERVALVEDLEVANAMFLLLERKKIVVEPSGATSLAAALNNKIGNVKGQNVCIILSGGNVDMSLLSRIIQQQLLNIGRKAVVKGEIFDDSVSLNKVLQKAASAKLKVISIQMERLLPRLNPMKALLVLELELPNPGALGEFVEGMKEDGIPFKRMEVLQNSSL